MLGALIQALNPELWCVLNEQFQQLVLNSEICGEPSEKLNWKVISLILFLFEALY